MTDIQTGYLLGILRGADLGFFGRALMEKKK